MTRNELLKRIDDDIPNAIEICKELFRRNKKSEFDDLAMKFIDQPVGYTSTTFREQLKAFVLLYFDETQCEQIDSLFLLCQNLLSQDFLAQKERLDEYIKGRKINFALLQGTANCGLHYFIMHKHSECHTKSIKADQLIMGDSDEEVWEQIVHILEIPLNVKNTKKDIPTVIGMIMENKLKEKSFVIVVYAIELWQNNYLNRLKRLTRTLASIPLEDAINPLYCYFVHTGNPNLSDDQEILVLPPVSELEENELKQLYFNNNKLFVDCDTDVKALLSGKKKLSQVIEIFQEHSSCGLELRNYFSKQDFS